MILGYYIQFDKKSTFYDSFGHFGRYNEPAIRDGEQCELTYPKSPLVQYNRRFRTSELTRHVP